MAATSASTNPSGHGPENLGLAPGETALGGGSSIRSTSLSGHRRVEKSRPRTFRDYRTSFPSHLSGKDMIASILRAAPPPSSPHNGTTKPPDLQRISSSPSSSASRKSDDLLLAEGASDSSPGSSHLDSPLAGYKGPTPKTLDGVREAFFKVKGLSLSSIKEWE